MLAYFATAVSYTCKKFTVLTPVANPIKHNGFFNKLVCLSKPVKVTGNNKNTLAYFKIFPFSLSMYVQHSPWLKILGVLSGQKSR